MSNGDQSNIASSASNAGASTATPVSSGQGGVCPPTSAEPDTSNIPKLELDVINAQHELDLSMARLTSNRAKAVAMSNRVAADAAWEQEKRKFEAAKNEAEYAKKAARDAAQLKFTVDLRDAPRSDGKMSENAMRLLEEQRCEAFHKAEVAYWTAYQKAELDWTNARAAWETAKLAQTHAETLADGNEALETTKAKIKYYQSLGKIFKRLEKEAKD
ncbi:MAG: hypothetical protein MJE77_06280 [Proteobacteria bacterium]|nr:hypothetical protein [Pseudomonadota bacterium]